MQITQLCKRSLQYYWRTNLAVILGVATAVAVLAGALLVGDSVRISLRDLTLQQLGQTSFAIRSTSFLREQLASEIQNHPQFSASGLVATCPLISLEGTVTHERSKRLASKITVYGVDERFWNFNKSLNQAPQDRSVLLSPTLARELGTKNGDPLIVQVQKPSEIPLESLHSAKENLGKTIRLTAGATLNADSLGEFSLQPQQTGVRALFVPLQLLQREIEQPGKVNLILVSGANDGVTTNPVSLGNILREKITLQDLGVNLRSVARDGQKVITLEHDSKIINDLLGTIARDTASGLSLRPSTFFSYLANDLKGGDHSVPYSLVTALDEPEFEALQKNTPKASSSDLPPIILNEWAASDLGVRPGDQITMDYYLWQEGGQLATKSATFALSGIVPIQGLAADKSLVPEYPGISGSENLSDWDPPFPVDLARVRQKDEDYWHKYATTPKAFIPLKTGQGLWQTRFGNATSMRFPSPDQNQPVSIENFENRLRANLNPMLMGVTVIPARAEGLAASRGATDFGEYFLYFSFILVISALLLTTLFFKLGIEQRIREVGILRAVGFGPAKIRTLFLIEGLALAIVGSLLGLVGAIAYGELMMFGLRTWWVDAVGTTSLQLHPSTRSLLLGGFGGIFAALLCVALTLRGLRRLSTRSLLAGKLSITVSKNANGRLMGFLTSFHVAILFTFAGVALLILTSLRVLAPTAGFFGGGILLLIAFLFYQSGWLKRHHKKSLAGAGWWPIAKLGFRNTTYRPARSILCIALIASAVFIIVAVDSFRHRGTAETLNRKSGTGGFPLLAESLVPLVKDPNDREGQEALNLKDDNPDSVLKGLVFTRFRLQPGDDTSCLNLYQPRSPKILAPTGDFVQSGRFSFQSSLANDTNESANPWLLLNRQFSDGAVPVIADANSLTYVLHLKLGDDLVMQHGDREIRMRVVAALSDSLFQSELLMSDANFTRLFPEQQGYRFFLLDLPSSDRSPQVTAALEDRLADFGFDVQPTSERLENFHRVENTYLSTFQLLGGLGLILGTIGLSAIMLRNVLERRRELALLRAVGYNSQHFTLMIIAENAALLLGGVATGTVCALLAIAPVLFSRQGSFSNPSLGLLLLAVLVSGFAASLLATWATLRTPLIPALRAE